MSSSIRSTSTLPAVTLTLQHPNVYWALAGLQDLSCPSLPTITVSISLDPHLPQCPANETGRLMTNHSLECSSPSTPVLISRQWSHLQVDFDYTAAFNGPSKEQLPLLFLVPADCAIIRFQFEIPGPCHLAGCLPVCCGLSDCVYSGGGWDSCNNR